MAEKIVEAKSPLPQVFTLVFLEIFYNNSFEDLINDT